MRDRTRIKDLQAPRRVRAYLAANAERSVLLLAGSEEAAERYAKDARCFTDESVVHLPSRGVLYGDVFAPPVVRVGERQRALNSLSEARIVVAGPLGFTERTPLYEPLRLEGGAEIELDDCLARLVELGYERVDRISRHGEFTVRGGIVDIFPSTRRSPVRAEWWGDEVESVRAVSLATQRVVRKLERVAVHGAREGDLTSLAAASEENLPEEARQGVRVPGLDRLLLALSPVSARDLLPRGIEVWAEEPAEGLPAEEDDRGTEDIVRELYEELPEPDLRFVTTADVGEVETVSAPPVTTPSTTIREAGRRLQSLVDEGLRVFVACSSVGEAKRTAYAFGEVGRVVEEARRVDSSLPPGLYAVPGEVEEGFSYPEGGVAVVRRDTLFGRQRARGMRTSSPSVSSFADLKSGDLVVHQVQGIGRFEGLVSKEVLGATRDYMQVSYQGGDTLFVPYEQMELLHKYVGGETARLDKLGGSSWAAVTDRVRSRVKALAGELLRVQAARASAKGFAFLEDSEWEMELEESFPYQETPDQAAAIAAVKADMQSPHPMDRLVCGDVGFGKTEVAVRATFKAALSGKQVMMLAPTTILVQQHHRTFMERLGRFPVRVESLSRFSTSAERKRTLRDFAAGEVDVLIGTHALLGAEVSPKDLGLVIVDEEQRFGVRHKERLKEFKASVDLLTLTATPIPRTMQMGLASLRDISVIETPPTGRRSILTHVGPYDEDLVRRAVENEVRRGGQVFFVHNRVESISEVAEELGALVPDAQLTTAHGQMPERALEDTMQRFLDREADVLVTTTIVESGLDVATANTLIVDRADAMGLAQLYQLRGRIGRSTEQAYAYLFAPLGATPESQKRLEALMDFTELGSGFSIAMRDLEIRGAGNLLGSEQSGQIAAVGFEMYLRLLEEAVALAKGQPARQEDAAPVIVELALDAYLPVDYVQDEIERVDLYRRASGVHTPAELDDLAEELQERFGEPPEPALSLLGFFRIKLLAREVGATAVNYRSGTLSITGVTAPATAPALIRRATGGTVAGREGRLTVSGSSLATLELAEETLRALARA
ncbi:MAG TPA: transcription-repair coupling factor [Rubrobacteraceae bacterium]|nr:transcription-repair coupling factor [Rubrobacteraceae bacterium]